MANLEMGRELMDSGSFATGTGQLKRKGLIMARLSANGFEVARFERTALTPDSDITVKNRMIYSIRSNGWVLHKRDVWFRPDSFNPSTRLHSYGWKRWRKAPPNTSPEQFLEILEPKFLKVGLVRVKG